MTLHASGSLGGELVAAMAVRTGAAQLGPTVTHVERFMAIAALPDRLFGRKVRMMAVGASD
jgi:hypothetical protein